jgi:hypothetical protein
MQMVVLLIAGTTHFHLFHHYIPYLTSLDGHILAGGKFTLALHNVLDSQ